MSRRLLEGESKVWIKIDNTLLENTEAIDIYKPRHGKNVSTDSLFTDTEEEKTTPITKHSYKGWVIMGIGLLAVVISVAVVMVYF